MINNFIHSTGALNVINKFYRKDIIIYVEGDDDKHFWSYFFSISSSSKNISFQIESLGCSNTLEEYIKKIINENAKFIVAMDSDHKPLLNTAINHNRIIYTYGYSIENTLYCPININRVISKIYKTFTSIIQEIDIWLNDFSKDSYELLLYDVSNQIYSKSIEIFGDTCCRFLESQTSINISSSKIKKFLSTITTIFTIDELNHSENLIKKDKRNIRFLIKGHFLTNAVINYIRINASQILKKGKPSIPLDMFYALIIDGCINCNKICAESKIIIKNIDRALKDLLTNI